MAQVRQETGANFSISENLNYAEPTLLNLFYYYRCHPKEAGVDGRTSTHAANQENIANKAYGGRNGNDRSGDGWLFRGQGLKQLTGRGNYREFTVYSKRTWRDSENYEINPRLISSNITLAVRTALYFWDSHNLYIEADKGYGREVSYAITKVVNKGTDSYEARFNHLNGFLSDGVFDGIF